MNRPLIMALALAVPTACSSTSSQSVPSEHPIDASAALTPSTQPPPPAVAAPPPAGELAPFERSNNAFGLDLYAKIRDQKGNLAISPASLSCALSLTWLGARGETAEQMKKVLHAEGMPEQAVDVAGKLVAGYRAAKGSATVRIANRLFGENGYPFERPFLDRARAAFGAPLDALDFRSDPEGSRTRINDWVLGETESRIKDLIPSGGLSVDTRLVLTNAISFQGDWKAPFDKAMTQPESFHVSASVTKDVSTMHTTPHQGDHFRFAATDGVRVLEMPYQGDALAMTLVVPDAVDGLDALEARLAPAVLDGWIAALREQPVKASLPKFEIDPPASIALRDVLAALGMPIAFDPVKADLTGIASPKSTGERLFVSKVFHRAFVKLDERGTEAAAASALEVEAQSLAPSSAELRADHPFLFFLRDVRSNLILFMGRVSDPSAK